MGWIDRFDKSENLFAQCAAKRFFETQMSASPEFSGVFGVFSGAFGALTGRGAGEYGYMQLMHPGSVILLFRDAVISD